jgi:malate dehydrogenase
VKLGAGGVEEIIEVDLDSEERAQLKTSAGHVHSNLEDLERLREEGKIG